MRCFVPLRDAGDMPRKEEPMNATRRTIVLVAATIAVLGLRAPAAHANAASLNAEASAALRKLYATNPGAKVLGQQAKAVLIFPKILKAGFIFGGQGGDGVMRKGGKTVGYYRTAAASYGFQAGVQSFGYALFFMNDSALKYLAESKGWELGSGPSLVIVDEGMAKSMTSTTLTQDVYAFIFDQKGLMAGIGIQGSKITRIHMK
jgi:lipid-binding SYLF domain-containing protein